MTVPMAVRSRRRAVPRRRAFRRGARATALRRRVSRERRAFLGLASHQLYTPLTALRGYLSMLQDEDFGTLSPRQRYVVGILRSSSDQLVHIVRDFLLAGQLEEGKLHLQCEACALPPILEELVAAVAPTAQQKRLALTLHPPGGTLPPVWGDPHWLRQVFLNILDNAVKFTERGRVDVHLMTADRGLLCRVEDSGRGLTPTDCRRIFRKYVRVDDPRQYRSAGTGLGLYVARCIVRAHGGRIWAESAGPGHGSVFCVVLPVAQHVRRAPGRH